MKTLIGDSYIQIGEQQLEYYSYYFGIWDREEDHRRCVQHTIWQWAAGIRQLGNPYHVVHLPYFLDDQWVDCLKATLKESRVILQCVRIRDAGYAIDLNDISDVLFGEHQYYKEVESDFGSFDLNDLVKSFEQAEIVDD